MKNGKFPYIPSLLRETTTITIIAKVRNSNTVKHKLQLLQKFVTVTQCLGVYSKQYRSYQNALL